METIGLKQMGILLKMELSSLMHKSDNLIVRGNKEIGDKDLVL